MATFVSMFIHLFHVHLLWKRISEMNGGSLVYLLAQVENLLLLSENLPT